MSIVIDSPIVRCGKRTARGFCKLILRGGKCPVHDNLEDIRDKMRAMGKRGGQTRATQFDSEYQARARSHVKRESLQKSGRAGYDKVGGVIWWAEQTEKARLWRLEHPSAHERVVMDALLQMLALDVHWDREVILDADPRAVDFVLYRDNRAVAAIEVTESAARATFGRDEKLATKVEWLRCGLGLAAHVFYGSDDLQLEFARLGAFLQEHHLAE